MAGGVVGVDTLSVMLQVPLIQRVPQMLIHHLPDNGGVYVTYVEFQLFNDMVDVIRNVVDGHSYRLRNLLRIFCLNLFPL